MKYMRMVAVFLALCLTFTCLPMTVCAGAGVIASGTCGENVTWTLGNNGELTISGLVIVHSLAAPA